MAKGAALTPPLPARGERYGEGLGALGLNEPIKRKTYHSCQIPRLFYRMTRIGRPTWALTPGRNIRSV